MTKAVAEMSLRMRAVLTPQQWQDLRQQAREARRRQDVKTRAAVRRLRKVLAGAGVVECKGSPRVDTPSQPAASLAPRRSSHRGIRRIAGTSRIRDSTGGFSMAHSRAVTICSSVSNPSLRAPSRVAGIARSSA